MRLRPCGQHPACCFVLQDTSPTSRDSGAPPGVQTPAYQVVERARVDLGSAWGDTGRALQYSNTPEVRTPVLAQRADAKVQHAVAVVQLTMLRASWVLQEAAAGPRRTPYRIVLAANPVYRVALYHWHVEVAGLQLLHTALCRAGNMCTYIGVTCCALLVLVVL